jgi:hypothetical protein
MIESRSGDIVKADAEALIKVGESTIKITPSSIELTSHAS